MKYFAIGASVTAAVLVIAIIAAVGYSALSLAAKDPMWSWIIPVVALAFLIGILAAGIEYLTDRREPKEPVQ